MMWKRLSIFLLVTVLFTFAVNFVYANDAVVGTGSPASCTEAAFDAALATVLQGTGGTMTFNCGGAVTIPFTSQKIITGSGKTVVINGGGNITLDGGNATRLFRIANGNNLNFTVLGLTLTNGRAAGYADDGDDASQGGAILFGYGNGILRIEDSNFINNTAVTNGGMWDGGGAIHIRIGQLFIEDSLFEGNNAPNGGAMNILITTGTVSTTVFRGNSATTTTGGGGGAIYIDNGMLTFDRVLVENNTSTRFGGGYVNCGGSANIGHETITNSTFRNNTILAGIAAGSGAGVYNCDDGITISNTTISGNVSPNHAGGFWHHSNSNASSTATVTNSTISGNTAQSGNGAGIASNGPAPMTITNSTIVNNVTGVQGSAIRAGDGTVTLVNTIVSNNSSAHEWVNEQCYGTIINGGGNLQYPAVEENGRSAICSASFTTADPKLDILQDNGGPTFTHALQPGSPAIDAGGCALTSDQRGEVRPYGGGCDIGAYEAGAEVPVLAPPANLSVTPNQGRPTLTWANDQADWYNIWIGTLNGALTVHYAWYPKNSDDPLRPTGQAPIQCAGDTCSLTPYIDPVAGTYAVYMQSWSQELGLSKSSLAGWTPEPAEFTLPNTPAGFVAAFTVTNADTGSPTFTWEAPQHTTWYQIWVGTAAPDWSQRYWNWHSAESLGCVNPSNTCSLTPEGVNLSAGSYVWYLQTWGPGGIGQNSLNGWVEADAFQVHP